jgi:hypothetical protein
MINEEDRLQWHMEQDHQGGPDDEPPPWGSSTRCLISCKPGVRFISAVVTYNTADLDGDPTAKTVNLIMPAGQPRAFGYSQGDEET